MYPTIWREIRGKYPAKWGILTALYAAGVMLITLFVMKCVELSRNRALPAMKSLLIEP